MDCRESFQLLTIPNEIALLPTIIQPIEWWMLCSDKNGIHWETLSKSYAEKGDFTEIGSQIRDFQFEHHPSKFQPWAQIVIHSLLFFEQFYTKREKKKEKRSNIKNSILESTSSFNSHSNCFDNKFLKRALAFPFFQGHTDFFSKCFSFTSSYNARDMTSTYEHLQVWAGPCIENKHF